MKTILISSFHPHISRNILQTDVWKVVVSSGSKIYILCPKHKESYFKENFESDQVRIVGVVFEPLDFIEGLWRRLSNALLGTSTVRTNQREKYGRLATNLNYLIFKLTNFLFANNKLVIKAWRFLVERGPASSQYLKLIDDIKPDLIFATDVFDGEDSRLMVAARRRQCLLVGMVRSWDNPTNKGILLVVPNRLIVHNEITAGEMENYHLVNSKSVFVSGIPQFDFYFQYHPIENSLFYRHYNFDPSRKIILFAPTGKKFVDDDWYILQLIHDAIKSGEIIGQPQMLVRLPPGDVMDLEKVKLDSGVRVFIEEPGVGFANYRRKDREFSGQDTRHLVDVLALSDILVSVGSTLCIDIATFDKPIICPKIQAPEVGSFRSMIKMYNKHHYQYLFTSRGCRLVETEKDLIGVINQYLSNPKIDQLGRKALVREQVGVIDGLAGKRIGQYLLAQMVQ